MKVSVYLKKNSSSTSNICFRVREKNVDIKVVSPLVVHDGKHGKIDPVGTDEIDPVKTA